MSSQSSTTKVNSERNIYIYDMPHTIRQKLCAVLDIDDNWKVLGEQYMKFDSQDIVKINRLIQQNGISQNSPTDELLVKWGNMNHTVLELFILLKKMNHKTAMETVKSLVSSKHHVKPITYPHTNYNCIPAFSQLQISKDDNSEVEKQEQPEVNAASKPKHVPIYKGIEPGTSKADGNSCSITQDVSLISIPCISYNELVEATKNWNKSNCIGSGGFGEVYKGEWKYLAVAIKKIKTKSSVIDKSQLQQSLNELRYLNSCRHDNILPLYGYSLETELCLVYQFMSGGSLERRLYKSQSKNQPFLLSWENRLKIAIGTAKGLQFLHTCRKKPLIHGDIKPANILLDSCNEPKIGDFGLVREGPPDIDSSMKISKVFGTKPYIPPEFIRGRDFSVKVDTFSFGVVLFELATGEQAFDNSREKKHIIDHVKFAISMNGPISNLIDNTLPIDDNALYVFRKFLSLGLKCTVTNCIERPYMEYVFLELTKS